MSSTRRQTAVRRILLFALALVTAMSTHLISTGRAEAAPGPSFTNPVVGAPNSADPTLVFHEGFYYYVATTWTSDIVMRRSATVAGLHDAAEQLVFRSGGTGMWAPHLEMIGDRWYLYYSVEQTGGPRRTHVLESSGRDPLGPYTDRGIMDLMPDNGWAIDASLLRLGGNLYMTFSAFSPQDNLQSLYIAPLSNPWTASARGTRISAPTLAWERQDGAVNEGSFALQRGGRTFLTYSASHCNGPNYKLGMLEYRGGDPLLASSWTKQANPIFQRNDAAGVFGPGHHSFFTSPDGSETWIAYHANSSASQGCGTTRTTRVQKISWNADGTPNLGVPVSTTTALPGPSGEAGAAAAPVTLRNRHSKLCLDDRDWATAPGSAVQQWTCGGATVQDWHLTPASNGYYQVRNRHSGLCLDNYNFATTPGSEVRQWTCNGNNAQQWRISAAGEGFSTLANRHSGLCLDNYNFATTPGSEVRQWTCNGNNAQQWSIA
ncbi:family 43 glycosylhydrolase [Streptomyces sp. H27-H1]|uniref:family 43 glycosylhydrolase n=1 Tax=Streptomyces sp. H27-H1 TaxID=2996461 RepID=UPI00226F29DB|nr:family 43 glycosylhydrolase [Streptomyces sp. H27-H1]MCY0925325.1 family 43 glycosylhydrolase [Streptomyces sp. H27-H1]